VYFSNLRKSNFNRLRNLKNKTKKDSLLVGPVIFITASRELKFPHNGEVSFLYYQTYRICQETILFFLNIHLNKTSTPNLHIIQRTRRLITTKMFCIILKESTCFCKIAKVNSSSITTQKATTNPSTYATIAILYSPFKFYPPKAKIFSSLIQPQIARFFQPFVLR